MSRRWGNRWVAGAEAMGPGAWLGGAFPRHKETK